MTTNKIHPSTAAMMLTNYAEAIRNGNAGQFGEEEAVTLDEVVGLVLGQWMDEGREPGK